MLLPAPALADAPAFDRPGINFAPSVLTPGSMDWEQGLPDLQLNSTGGVRTNVYTADTTVRFGLTTTLEFQIAGALWNRLDVSGGGMSQHSEGAGDTRLALKWSPALSAKDWSFGVLGSLTLDTGAAAFTNGRPIYSLGAVLGRDLGSGRSFDAYANVDRSGGVNTWTVAGSFSFPISGTLGSFLEVGHVSGGGASSSVVGTGLTWLLHDRVQFDLYGRRGLTSRSPDVQAGFGISLFWN